MKTFPWKNFELRCTLPVPEVMRRLEQQVTPTGKEFTGSVTAQAFAMRNHSKLPSQVEGQVSASGNGSAIKVLVQQHKFLTLGELALLGVITLVANLFFPELMSDGSHVAMLLCVVVILYLLGFYAEVEQARNFLCEVLGEEETAEE